MTEHQWGEWKITKQPTATTTGERTSKCSKCGKAKTEVIKATGLKSIQTVVVSGLSDTTYTGKPIIPKVKVELGKVSLVNNTDYTIAYTNNINAGTATVTITGKGNYTGLVTKTFKINKAANTLKVKAKTPAVKYARLKEKKQIITARKAYTVSKAKGTVTFKLAGVSKSKFKKYFKVSKSGIISIKKGLKKGTYKVKVKVKAAGNKNYNAKSKTVTVKIKVK